MKDDLRKLYSEIDSFMASMNADAMSDSTNNQRFSWRIINRWSTRYHNEMSDGTIDEGVYAGAYVEFIDSWCTLNNCVRPTGDLFPGNIDTINMINGWAMNSFVQFAADGVVADSPSNINTSISPMFPANRFDDKTRNRRAQTPTDDEIKYLTRLFANFDFARCTTESRHDILDGLNRWTDMHKVPECYERFSPDNRVAFLDDSTSLIIAFGEAALGYDSSNTVAHWFRKAALGYDSSNAVAHWFILYKDTDRLYSKRDKYSWHSIMFESKESMLEFVGRCDPSSRVPALLALNGIC